MVDIAGSSKNVAGRPPAEAEPLGRAWPQALVFPKPARRERSPADLARMIESEIIPRLMMAHAPRDAEPVEAGEGGLDAQTLDAFVRMTLTREAPALTAYIEGLIQDGLPLERAYVELMVPTARRLGDDWNEDLISFTDVTIGLSRLQQVVRGLAVRFPTRGAAADARSACFVTAPSEQHAFGLFLVEDQFRRAGWRTWLDTAATREDAAQAVSLDWFDVFGLSATSDTPVEAIAATIALVRKCSPNPRLFVLVGGRLFIDEPDLGDTVGADSVAATAADALSLADKAVRACESRPRYTI